MDSIPSDIYADDDKLPDTGSLGRFPDDIIQHLLRFVLPEDNLQCFQLLCHRCYRLANDGLLWRYHCRSTFRYWRPDHSFGEKLQATVASVDWKYLFLLRTRSNHIVSQLLDGIVETKVGRFKKIEKICRLGYDAKDFLLVQCHIHESAPDVLARSNVILDNIHRSIALEEWSRLGLDRDSLSAQVAAQRLERALSAFDMFVLHDQTGDLDDISQMLDDIIARFRVSCTDLSELTTRETALALNRWVRANNLTGLRRPEQNYRNLRNCLIGQALRHEEHESIPLISSAIFCSLAARLGLNAQCCALHSHVYAIVFAQSGYTLDGDVVDSYHEQPERMYLDPYGLDNEVPASDLQDLLAHYAWQTSTDAFLAPAPPQTMVLRTAQNIKATFARILELQDDAHPELSQLLRGNDAMNVDAALYSAMWSSLMLTPPDTFEWNDRLASFLHRFAGSWPEDVWLVEKYLWPMYNSFTALRHGFARHVNRGLGDPWDHWRLVRDQDDLIPPMSRRDLDGNQSVTFKIGQVFRHRRYGWIGVITGWPDQGTQHLPVATSRDTDDESDTAAPGEHPRVPVRLPNQFYFMCFPSNGSEPNIIAADNIELIDDFRDIDDNMFPVAGKFFRRFDPESCRFVSNMKEQYPDD
ncbi:transglutaminase-like superfamily protein [Metarhizium robertsii]|uniref:Transglutaminase-like superfamily protein n=1 Tax=Metarhizium robertsii TaxID=568076 RepID=A0A014MU04_9HYPO|nr:transglutaminase-like superfamily protein [Metarhizium robertsii]